MRDCRTPDEILFAFVDGVQPDLEEHVAGCDECQEFLAELWIGELKADLRTPVLRQIRFDEFLREVGQLTADVIGAMGRAFMAYGPGADKSTEDPEGSEE